MKLQQGQVWKQNDGDQYFRIVELERLAVKFKAMTSLASRDGSHHDVTKKEFCRLIRHCTLLAPADLPAPPAAPPRGGRGPQPGPGPR